MQTLFVTDVPPPDRADAHVASRDLDYLKRNVSHASAVHLLLRPNMHLPVVAWLDRHRTVDARQLEPVSARDLSVPRPHVLVATQVGLCRARGRRGNERCDSERTKQFLHFCHSWLSRSVPR